MAEAIWFPLYPERFLASRKVRKMDAMDLGIYMALLMEEWMEAGPLPDDDEELEIAGRAPIEDVRRVLHTCFTRTAEGWENETLEQIRQEQLSKHEHASRSGKKGAEVRWGRRKKATPKEVPLPKEPNGNPIATLSPPQCYPNAIREERGEEKEKLLLSQPATKKAAPYESEFEEFWEDYPRKIDRKKSLKAYQARRRQGVPAAELLAGRDRYKAHLRSNGTDPKYIKHAATFLGPNEHWRESYDDDGHDNTVHPSDLAGQW